MSRVFVTGAAGFIGSSLVDRLLAEGKSVVGYDNLSTGQIKFLESALKNPRFQLIQGDLLDVGKLRQSVRGSDFVFHFAANADVRHGLKHPERDLQQNTIATFNLLEAMRENQILSIAFASTGSVYGESKVIPTPEDAPFPLQTSLYGASKLACEGLIQAYAEGYGMRGYIFRFVSILGERYTHGHIFDFYQQLREHPDYLQVLGDGTQRKSYLYIGDCLRAVLQVVNHQVIQSAPDRVQIYNLGTDAYCQVNDSVRWICERLNLTPRIEYTGGDRGWVGDNPFIYLSTNKIRSTGWTTEQTIQSSVIRTVDWIRENEWIYKIRE